MIRNKVVRILNSSSCITSKQSELASSSPVIGSFVSMFITLQHFFSEIQKAIRSGLQRVCGEGKHHVKDNAVSGSGRLALHSVREW